jgi:hypothetical protein
MTGIPSEVLERRNCSHCWHDTGIAHSHPTRYGQVCCHCGGKRLRTPPEVRRVPGHGPHYPCPWTWGAKEDGQ